MEKRDIRLVALDMDGTLLDSQNRQPADFEEWVRAHENIQTVIASGRQYFTLKQMFPGIADKLIFAAENGSIVFAGDRLIHCNSIAMDKLRWCVDYFENEDGAQVLLCGAKAAYMKHARKSVEDTCQIYYKKVEFVDSLYDVFGKDDIVKLAIYYENAEVKDAYERLSELPGELDLVMSGKNWMDISNKNVSKGSAIEAIQQNMGISREESMAFGDYMNDYTMLLSCEESYAMANAVPEIKEIAKHIAGSNDEDGVMTVLREL